jgi:hypothetical protein
VEVPGKPSRHRPKEEIVAPSTTDALARNESPAPPTAAVDPVAAEQASSRREAVLVAVVVAIVAAVVLFGLVFPALLAPAAGIGVLAVIVVLEWLLPSGELPQAWKRTWRR